MWHAAMNCLLIMVQCSLTGITRDSWCKWSIEDIAKLPVAILNAWFCTACSNAYLLLLVPIWDCHILKH